MPEQSPLHSKRAQVDMKAAVSDAVNKALGWWGTLDPKHQAVIRNAAIGAGAGAAGLGAAGALRKKDPDERKGRWARQALLGAVLGGTAAGSATAALPAGAVSSAIQRARGALTPTPPPQPPPFDIPKERVRLPARWSWLQEYVDARTDPNYAAARTADGAEAFVEQGGKWHPTQAAVDAGPDKLEYKPEFKGALPWFTTPVAATAGAVQGGRRTGSFRAPHRPGSGNWYNARTEEVLSTLGGEPVHNDALEAAINRSAAPGGSRSTVMLNGADPNDLKTVQNLMGARPTSGPGGRIRPTSQQRDRHMKRLLTHARPGTYGTGAKIRSGVKGLWGPVLGALLAGGASNYVQDKANLIVKKDYL